MSARLFRHLPLGDFITGDVDAIFGTQWTPHASFDRRHPSWQNRACYFQLSAESARSCKRSCIGPIAKHHGAEKKCGGPGSELSSWDIAAMPKRGDRGLTLKKTCRMVRLELLLQKTWLAYNYAELDCSHSQLFLEDAASFSMSEAQPCQQTGSFCVWPTPPSSFFLPIKVNKCSWWTSCEIAIRRHPVDVNGH